jgi:hypothetical protein
VAVIVQPVHDAAGGLLYQVGDQLAEDHRALKGLPPGTWRHEIVEDAVDESKPAAKVTSKPISK